MNVSRIDKKRTILAFDPGSVRNLGWASLSLSPPNENGEGQMTYRASTFLSTTGQFDTIGLWQGFMFVDSLIQEEKPDVVLIERTTSFSDGANMWITSQVAGSTAIILACCGKNDVLCESLHPVHVKKVVAEYGRATKAKIRQAVNQLLTGEPKGKQLGSEHAYDAMALILCYLLDNKVIIRSKGEE